MEKGTNILLSLQQLTIGGAETHVVELAKELKRRGYNVVVTSKGGVYEKELAAAGIKHYYVPLHTKNPVQMVKAARTLARVIRDEKIDIVHSHARISSFILGKLHKVMKFPYVTTAHWVFTTKYGLKYITDWGEKCVAVSEDIKTYLMDNYKIPARDIRVTINGIDTDKFSPDTDCSDICKEFGVNPENENIISYVSRMDESRSLVAKQLINIVPELDKKIENLRVVIVGDGDDFSTVKSRADAINAQLGRNAVVLTGGRTDINKFAAICKIFVGVSRSALEAMAAEKPVIIAGNEGYIGLFDESKLPVGIETNFCCRGCAEPAEKLLLNDVLKFFGMSAEEKKALGVYGRELIKRDYSVHRMADDCVKVYDWALAKHKEILVSGYYGFKNSGDDALLSAIINDISKYKESPNLVVLSKNPAETQKYYRVKSINRFNIPGIMRHMKNAEMLISGGGTLMQDGTSTKSLWYYLYIIRMALKRNLKVMLYSNGIGPLNHENSREITRDTLNRVNLITLRDEASAQLLDEIGVTKPKILVTADPALDLDGEPKENGRALLESLGVPKGKKIFGISVRRWQENGPNFERILAEVCDYVSEKYDMISVFIPMQMERDLAISQSIAARMKNKAVIVKSRYSVEKVMSMVSAMDLCIGMRLHSLIYAAAASIPLIGIVYDPKVSSFMEHTHQNLYIDVKNLTADGVKVLIDKCMDNYNAISEDLRNNYKDLREKAELNAKLAADLYEKGRVDIG